MLLPDANGSGGLCAHPPDLMIARRRCLFGLRAAFGCCAGLRLATRCNFVSGGSTRLGTAGCSSAGIGCFVSRSFGSRRAVGGLTRARTGCGRQGQPAHDCEKAGQFCILHRNCPFDCWCAHCCFKPVAHHHRARIAQSPSSSPRKKWQVYGSATGISFVLDRWLHAGKYFRHRVRCRHQHFCDEPQGNGHVFLKAGLPSAGR